MTLVLSPVISLLVAFSALVSLFSNGVSAQGNVTCATNFTNWYSDVVGETPCMTYYRLRSICNAQYQVPSFRPNTPGDNCDDQVADCCCNSISWALSMLCMNCQQDVSTTTGIDAGKGAYQMYLDNMGCSPNTNMSLPSNIKLATCNTGVRLQNFLYGLFWNDGSWYYEYTTETGVTGANTAGSNTSQLFTSQGCPTTTTSTTSGKSTSTSTSSGSNSPSTSQTTSNNTSHMNIGAAVGGAVGGLAGLAILVGLGVFCWRKRKRTERERVAYIESMAQRGTRIAGGPSMSFSGDPSQPSYPHSHSAYAGSSAGATHTETSYSHRRRPSNMTSPDLGPTSPTAGGAYYAPVPNQEEDLGPLEEVGVSRAGTTRLPPAYNHSWRESRRPGAGPVQGGSGDVSSAERTRQLPQTPDESAAWALREKSGQSRGGGEVGRGYVQ
ncbi:hypothetical protein CONPUDRAFT_134640 [Coniophora puteana RWD-64-598 SS2]|uniref:Mid2 domain-containing protein n=1 Tax=Coniophora puteana (strain RWD-64-598) TaxID=741705 RepID=A0A5M3MZZ8_CONPW|nr:uncharacterized protein CONPUDRAFT_134640 [Coniophora puteana RWD-64-598 SS2]EIW84698.1 hypothetical protein CONPUDRAFT_134640 [Coniophora puteana RWD-64-598 SS2]